MATSRGGCLPKTLENMQVQGNSCPGTKVALDLMLIQFEASYDMGKQTIEGPKENDGDLNTFEVPMVQNCIMLDKNYAFD